MLVALDWLLLIRPLLNTKLVTLLNSLGIFVKWASSSKLIDFSNIKNGNNGLHC